MNLITAKTVEQIALKGLKIDWQKHDGGVRTVVLTDVDGRSVTITRANSYSETLTVLIPEPPKKAQRFVLHGEVAGITIKKAYDTEAEANTAISEFGGRGEFEITKTEVIVDDAGQPSGLDDMPF
jgi:hypothetical protein